MIRYKYIILLLIGCLTCNCVSAQKDDDDVYSNFEKNYNDLLQSYYIQTNEKMLNQRFGGTTYSTNRASSVSDEVYEQRLKSIPSCVKLVYNSTVRNHIIYYIDRIGDRVGVMLGMSKYYFPIFENILDAYGVPSDLKYLVMIESAFNPRAVSRAGATGLWQFMYATGRTYDLRVNTYVDDRRDPIKSTVAAAQYLKDLYSIYNDWSLVLAAYNCGPGNVNKAIKRSGKNNFWEIYQYLPKETRNYVPAFIAATYVMNFHNEHGIYPVDLSEPLDLLHDTIIVKKDVYFPQIEKVLNISVAELRDMNPQYKMDYIPGTIGEYSLRLPLKYINAYIEAEDSIANVDKEKYNPEILRKFNVSSDSDETASNVAYKTKTIYHKVQSRDSWSTIARRYGVSVSNLRKWNKKIRSNKLKKGTLIAVKQRVAEPQQKTSVSQSSNVENNAVNKSDNNSVVSKKTTVEDNKATLNKQEKTLNDNKATVGKNKTSVNKQDKADNSKKTAVNKNNAVSEDKKSTSNTDKTNKDNKKISTENKKASDKNTKNSKQQTQQSKQKSHTVQSGETIGKIAAKYKMSEAELLKLNGLNQNSAKKIRPGQKLKLK